LAILRILSSLFSSTSTNDSSSRRSSCTGLPGRAAGVCASVGAGSAPISYATSAGCTVPQIGLGRTFLGDTRRFRESKSKWIFPRCRIHPRYSGRKLVDGGNGIAELMPRPGHSSFWHSTDSLQSVPTCIVSLSTNPGGIREETRLTSCVAVLRSRQDAT
jgi:hypothetical protein